MPTMTHGDIDLVCTHADLIDELGSERALRQILPVEPDNAEDPTKTIREQAYRDVLRSLLKRTPPILESQLSDIVELKSAVVFGTLLRLYRSSMSNPDDLFGTLWKEYESKFRSEVTHLRVTVDGVASVDVASISMFRR
jgi:hypothetical protein